MAIYKKVHYEATKTNLGKSIRNFVSTEQDALITQASYQVKGDMACIAFLTDDPDNDSAITHVIKLEKHELNRLLEQLNRLGGTNG